ncbi:MAG: hypothetical protein JWO36_7020 [Myxococcales bacterium]|nr:hypothetical protein [Myxococcales bacterium]
MRRLWIAILLVGLCANAFADDHPTARHLLAGVRLFKDARYEEALVELRIVAHAADAPTDLAFYLGPTLYKLGRHREALAVFVASRAAPDALTDFYVGETYYALKLFRKARAVFAGLRTRGLGPALDEAARSYVETIDLAYKTAPKDDATLSYYIAVGVELAPTDPSVAGEFLDEARLVEALGTDRKRHGDILDALGAAWNRAGRPSGVVEVLGAEPGRSEEATWQLARAYLALDDSPHARAFLAPIANAGGPHASDAAAILAKTPP